MNFDATCTLDPAASDTMRFQILRPHARGGLGEVFVAKDLELGREVALKEIQLDKSDDAEARSRFLREAEITGGLEHPGVVPVYSLGTYPDGRPFYAMRFIRGQTLADAITAFHAEGVRGQESGVRERKKSEAERHLELRRLLQRFIDVCEAIDYAHSRGVLHRDLKPGNIMLGRYGETLVVDWGLAKASGESKARPVQAVRSASGASVAEFAEPPVARSGSHQSDPTQMGFVPGTPAYMSPEHALGRLDLMGPASDVFSLGATLYHLLTGRPPYVGKSAQEVQQLAQSGNYPPPGSIVSLPRALDAVCRKALATSPADRYSSPRSLAADLERYLGDEPVEAYPEPLQSRVSRWMRRHSRLVAIGVICFLIVPICLGTGLYVALEEKRVAESAEERAEVGQLWAATALAHNALQVGDHPTAARALERAPVSHRNWTFDYLSRQLAFHAVVAGETAGVACLAVDSGSRQLAYGTHAGEISTRDPHSGQEVQRVRVAADGAPVSAIAYSTSASQLAVALGNQVQLHNAATLAMNLRIQLPASVTALLFSPDDRRLIALLANKNGAPRVMSIDMASGGVIWSALDSDSERLHACLCSDGSQIVVAAGDELSVLSAADGECERTWKLAGGSQVASLLSAAEGRLVAGTSDGMALAYALDSGELIRSLELNSSVVGASFVGNNGNGTPWKEERAPIVSSMALADSSNAVLVSSAGDVWIVDTATGEIHKKLTHKTVLTAAGSRGGGIIALADQDELFVFEPRKALEPLSREFRVFPAPARCPALSSDGRTIAFALHDSIVVHDVDAKQHDASGTSAGAVRWTIPSTEVRSLDFSRDGRLLVALADDLRVFDAQSGACLLQSPPLVAATLSTQSAPQVQSAVIDASNRYVAVDGDMLQVWDITTGQRVAQTPLLPVRSLRLAESGDMVLGNVEDTIRGWRIPDLKETGRITSGCVEAIAHTRIIGGQLGDLVGIGPGNSVLERNGNRWLVRQWPTCAPVCSLEHDAECLAAAFHPTGRRVATGGADGKIIVWQYPTASPMLELPFSRTIAALCFSADGARLIAIDREGKVGIWDRKAQP